MKKNRSNHLFVNTIFALALVNPRDQYHLIATTLAQQCEGQPLLTTDAVLLEIGNALARNYKKQSIKLIEQFFNSEDMEVVRLTPALFEQAFQLYKTYEDKAWGLIDGISFVVMWQAGITKALTVDQHFVQAGFDALMCKQP